MCRTTDYSDSTLTNEGSIKPFPTMANPPPVGSEWKRLTPQFLGIFSILTAVYGSIYYAFQDSETILGFPRPGDEFCADAKSAICSRSDLFAFQIASGLSFLVMGGFGFYYWHVKGIQNTIPATPAGRCFSYIPEAEFVAVVCFTFQVWDFFHFLGNSRAPHTYYAYASYSGICGELRRYALPIPSLVQFLFLWTF
mmetsp:Transcript_11257/g.14832  ORF Transcript_11257/g.14832 Transcript_11257/m.14832 type:complete len:196 (+) Transcript_11257:177-764(+)